MSLSTLLATVESLSQRQCKSLPFSTPVSRSVAFKRPSFRRIRTLARLVSELPLLVSRCLDGTSSQACPARGRVLNIHVAEVAILQDGGYLAYAFSDDARLPNVLIGLLDFVSKPTGIFVLTTYTLYPPLSRDIQVFCSCELSPPARYGTQVLHADCYVMGYSTIRQHGWKKAL